MYLEGIVLPGENAVNETRKLVKWGSSNTLIVSLPRKWTKRNSLTDRNEVHMSETPTGNLIISPQSPKEQNDSCITINAEKYTSPLAISQVLLTKYLDGYGSIIITKGHGFSPGEIGNITDISGRLLGFEITKKTPTEIILKDIMSIQETHIPLLIKILSRQTNELYSTFLEILQDGPSAAGQTGTILQSQENITKYFYRINRQLRKSLIQPTLMAMADMGGQEIVDYAFYITYVHEASSMIANCARAIIKHGYLSPPKKMLEYLNESKNIFVNATRSLLFQQVKRAFEILEAADELNQNKRKIETEIDQMITTESLTSLQIILDYTERTVDIAKNIALTTIRSNI